jgi:hypothetical protein
VPLSIIEGVSPQQADALAEHGVNDIDGLAATTVDDLVEFLDVSLDEAEQMLEAAKAVIALREQRRAEAEETEPHAVSAELDENVPATEVEPNDEMTAAGYDEAVRQGVPYQAEQNILSEDSADPIALSEADPMSTGELILQEAGRDLRPDVITPSPDITSTAVADLQAAIREEEAELANEEAASAAENETSLASSSDEEAASESTTKPDVDSESDVQ